MRERVFAFLLVSAACALAACGGGGGGSAVAPGTTGVAPTATTPPNTLPTTSPSGTPTTGPLSSQRVTMSIVIPKKTSSSSTRRSQYIPPNTGSMTLTLLTVNGSNVTDTLNNPVFNLTPGASNPNCTVSGTTGNTTCTFTVNAPVGKDIFVANTFTGSDGKTGPNGSGAILLSVTQNATNTANLTLTGPIASVQVLSGTYSLSNGNPITQVGGASVARSPVTARAAARAGRTAAGTRRAAGVTNNPSASPPTNPVALTARIFVLALDAQGNQIINPTTFDTPITLRLNLTGTPANIVQLGVTYAGIPGEGAPSSPVSTDGGTVQVYAPTDIVTLTQSATTVGNGNDSVNVVGAFTPSGGSAVTTSPLFFSISDGPPLAWLVLNATHNDPLTSTINAPLSVAVSNAGTAPTSGTIEVDGYFYGNLTYVDNTGSNAAWSCTTVNGYLACTTTTVIPPGGSLPLVWNVTPSNPGSTPISTDYEAEWYGSGSGFANNYAISDDTVNINPLTGPLLSFTPPYHTALTDGNFAQGTGATISLNLANSGPTATTGTTTVTDTLPAGMTYLSTSSPGWACSGTTTVTCTTSTPIAASGNGPPLSFTVSGPTSSGVFSNSFGASSSGATFGGATSENITVYGPMTFTVPASSASNRLQLLCLGSGCSAPIVATEPLFASTLTASLTGSIGGTPCSAGTYMSLGNTTASGPSGTFQVVPVAATGAGNACTVHITDGLTGGFSVDVPVTVTNVAPVVQ